MPNIILVDDEPLILDAMTRCLYDVEADIYRFTSPRDALDFVRHQKPDLIISDQRMPGMLGTEMLAEIKSQWPQLACILVSAYNDFKAVSEAFNQGIIERYICKPWDDQELEFVVKKSLQPLPVQGINADDQAGDVVVCSADKQSDIPLLDKFPVFHGMVSKDPSMVDVFRRISKASTANVPIFITGETGTGKELVAKACHRESYRKDKPFIAVNCANFTESLIESQLFGHKKGAFTGADQDRKGLIEEAGKGTLFLDEVTTLPLALQAKLLRVIQEREFSPLGSHQVKNFEAQLITASSQSLQSAVREGNFREDLFYRLNVLVIDLPALRHRGNDIELLATYLLEQLSQTEDRALKSFSTAALTQLCNYSWPGNIRQLENFVHSLIVLSSDTSISADLCRQQLSYFDDMSSPHTGPLTQDNRHVATVALDTPAPSNSMSTTSSQSENSCSPAEAGIAGSSTAVVEPLWLQEKRAIEQAVSLCAGNIPKAAVLLEVSPSTIYRKIQAWEAKGVSVDIAK